jgi:SAM-dependent methyltransferase
MEYPLLYIFIAFVLNSVICDRAGYNRRMNLANAARLIELNREFYTRFGDSFSATRHRIQPGVRRVLETLNGDENILDLGCGNGWLAHELAQRSHRGSYLGVDFSLPLLQDAESLLDDFSAKFLQVDITKLAAFKDQISIAGGWSLITSFATLHHIPSVELRMDILTTVRELLKPDGLFIHSNWQFLKSEKLKSRIQDWSRANLSPDDVDANDYLLDWRSGGEGLRYVHHFSEDELQNLAEASGFHVEDTFYSDGKTGDLGLYQVWAKQS